jgi:hypothetical protein
MVTYLLSNGDISVYMGSAKQGWITSLKELRNHINTVHLAYSHAILMNVGCKNPDQPDDHIHNSKNIGVYNVEAARDWQLSSPKYQFYVEKILVWTTSRQYVINVCFERKNCYRRFARNKSD